MQEEMNFGHLNEMNQWKEKKYFVLVYAAR